MDILAFAFPETGIRPTEALGKPVIRIVFQVMQKLNRRELLLAFLRTINALSEFDGGFKSRAQSLESRNFGLLQFTGWQPFGESNSQGSANSP